MNKEIIFSMNTAFRGEFNIHGYSYGRGDKAACIVGSMRGNEYQQLYMCSLLAQRLAEIEAQGGCGSRKGNPADPDTQLQFNERRKEKMDLG